jgi:hypothetical protein
VSETFYTPEEIAVAWKLSPDTVRRIFQNEPGVLVFQKSRLNGRRRYRTLRIPDSVAERVYHRLALKGNGRAEC